MEKPPIGTVIRLHGLEEAIYMGDDHPYDYIVGGHSDESEYRRVSEEGGWVFITSRNTGYEPGEMVWWWDFSYWKAKE